jgi:two-component system OmpR family response regulator
LLARVRALARRFDPSGGDPQELRVGDLVLDLRGRTARRGVTSLDLTATEWNLLEYLMRHPGHALSRQQILDYVWSYERDVQPGMVDVYISYLRRKIEHRRSRGSDQNRTGSRLPSGGDWCLAGFAYG